MYSTLLFLHSALRWVFLILLAVAVGRAYWGILRGVIFRKADRWIHISAAAAGHTQLLVGMILYFYSPFVEYFWIDPTVSNSNPQFLFFSIVHVVGMMIGMMLMSVGSVKSKQAINHRMKFRGVAMCWSFALLLILLLIPWPCSPLAHRPLWRGM